MAKAMPADYQDTAYYKLLKFAYDRSIQNRSFTEEEACTDTHISPSAFSALKTVIVTDPNTTPYEMDVRAFLDYVNFLELRNNREAAARAESHALWAQVAAVIAIIISIAMPFFASLPALDTTQVKLLTGTTYKTRLDPPQLRAITTAIQAANTSSQVAELLDDVKQIRSAVEPHRGASVIDRDKPDKK